MEKRSLRVMLASEYPEVRHFLDGVVEEQGGSVIVGQAENAAKALALARNLRPDVAIIDCYLPYKVGLDAVPLSRIGGLDTAQVISEEIPNARVVLVNNLDSMTLQERGLRLDDGAFFAVKTNGSSTQFTLQDLYAEAATSHSLVFANVEIKQRATLNQKIDRISGRAILFGGFGIIGGILVALTVILAPAGIVLAAAGAATMLFGLLGKAVTFLRLKVAKRIR